MMSSDYRQLLAESWNDVGNAVGVRLLGKNEIPNGHRFVLQLDIFIKISIHWREER